MEPYVCSECGESHYYKHDIRRKHGKIYCERCYLRYTTIGDAPHIAESASSVIEMGEPLKKPTKYGKKSKGHSSHVVHAGPGKESTADQLFHLIMLPFVWVYDGVNHLMNFLFIKPFTWVYDEFSNLLYHLGRGIGHLSNATIGMIKIIIFLALCYLGVTLIFGNGIDKVRAYFIDLTRTVPMWKNCSATLDSGMCAPDKPFYCEGGVLVQKSDICGCEDNYRVFQNTCVETIKCNDGTFWPDCSSNKPYQCQKEGLIQNSSACGCPAGQVPDGDACREAKNCPDGTVEGQCSPNQPYYCANGNLVERASFCGCPIGSKMKSVDNHNTESCVVSSSNGWAPTSAATSLDMGALEVKIHEMVNSERAKNGLPAISWDDALSAIARAHSQDMATNNYFSHINQLGQDPTARSHAAGHPCYGIAENINLIPIGNVAGCDYVGSSDSAAACAMDGWMNSPGHRANILSSMYAMEGIGASRTSSYIYITENFC